MDNLKWQDYLKRVSCGCCDRGQGSWTKIWEGDHAFDDPDLATFNGSPQYAAHLDFFESCSKILDIGCGVGHAVKYLKGKGKSAYGITADSEELVVAKERLGVDIVQGDMHELPWSDEFFDGAFFWDSLEHCISPIVALWEAWRVLKVGGRLIVEMDDENGVIEPSHYFVPNNAQMKELMIHARFKIDRIRQWGTWGGTYECHKMVIEDADHLHRLRIWNRAIVPTHFSQAKFANQPLRAVDNNL